MKFSFFLLAMILSFSAGKNLSFAGSLDVGSAAPKLSATEWLKGEPVLNFEKGKVYVVEFWATWCGPCRRTTPFLSKLQEKYKNNLVVIGVAGSENGSTHKEQKESVQEFIENMGENLNYRIALDSKRSMLQSWMLAANLKGLPSAFLIDGEGKIIFIGHPGAIEEPIADALGYDLEAERRAEKTVAENAHQLYKNLLQELELAKESKGWDRVLEIADRGISQKIGPPGRWEIEKLNARVKSKKFDPVENEVMAKKIIESAQGHIEIVLRVLSSFYDPEDVTQPLDQDFFKKEISQAAKSLKDYEDNSVSSMTPFMTADLGHIQGASGNTQEGIHFLEIALYDLTDPAQMDQFVETRQVYIAKAKAHLAQLKEKEAGVKNTSANCSGGTCSIGEKKVIPPSTETCEGKLAKLTGFARRLFK